MITDELRNPLLQVAVAKDNPLKDMLVEYVGIKHNKEDVTVEMIVATLAAEFPEFLLVVAEENFFRGYRQAMDDIGETVSIQTETQTNDQVSSK